MSNPFTIPAIPADLAEIIATHKALFGGFRMVDEPDPKTDPAKTDPPKVDPAKSGDGSGADADEALGEAGKKALEKERSQRKELEKQLAGVKAFQEGLAKLVTGDGEQPVKPEEALQKLSDKVDQLTHSNLVKDVAREFGITAKADIDWLTEMKTEEAIRGLAERLKPADDGKGKDKTRQQYRPDPSAGQGGSGGTPSTDPREAGRAEARRRFGNPNKSNQKD